MGTLLVSQSWRDPKKIVALDARRVRLQNLGPMKKGLEFVRSFPTDVRLADSAPENAD